MSASPTRKLATFQIFFWAKKRGGLGDDPGEVQIHCKKTIRKHLPQDPPRFLAKKKVAKYEFFNVESKHFPKNGGGIGDGRNVEKTDRRHLPQDPPFFS